MFPFRRMAIELFLHRKAEKLPPDGTHISTHTCMPWDLDMWMEMNNGRTLSIYDLGRITLALRVGLGGALKRRGWGMTMAGASVRWRRRVRMFHRFEVHSTGLGHDERFLYIHQSMWRKGEALSSVLYRVAVTDKNGIVPTREVLTEAGQPDWNPELPEWVKAWIEAEAKRPWPPIDPPA